MMINRTYSEYKRYHDALKETNFEVLSNIIFSVQTIEKKHNEEVEKVNSSNWEDKVNTVLKTKLLYSTNAMQSLKNDMVINMQSIIDNGLKLLSVLELLKEKDTLMNTLSVAANELKSKKNSAYSKLSSIENKESEEYREASLSYSNLSSKYDKKLSEITACQEQINELGLEADTLIKILQGISFTANITGLLDGSVVPSAIDSEPGSTVIEEQPAISLETQNSIANSLFSHITDLGTTGQHTRQINYQGASWAFFSMKDPMCDNMTINRHNKAGERDMNKGGSHPFAAINILTNLGYFSGTTKDIVTDVAAAFGTVKEKVTVNGNTKNILHTTGFKQLVGEKGIGTDKKFHTIMKILGIETTPLNNLKEATEALENNKLVHCISQPNSSITSAGHYMILVGVEKNNSGEVTGYYLLDSLARTQNEFDSLVTNKYAKTGAIDVIEPGLIRLDGDSDKLRSARLGSFRAVDERESLTKTVFSYEEYLKLKNQ